MPVFEFDDEEVAVLLEALRARAQHVAGEYSRGHKSAEGGEILRVSTKLGVRISAVSGAVHEDAQPPRTDGLMNYMLELAPLDWLYVHQLAADQYTKTSGMKDSQRDAINRFHKETSPLWAKAKHLDSNPEQG